MQHSENAHLQSQIIYSMRVHGEVRYALDMIAFRRWAGLYYKKMGCARDALVHFQQAHACYKEWGSNVKVGAIQRELDGFNSIGTNFI